MENLLIALNAVLPFIIYLSLGAITRVSGAAEESFLKKLNTFAFRFTFPMMMFKSVYNIDRSQGLSGKLTVAVFLAVLATIFLAVLIVPRLVKDNRRRGSIIQAVYRSNSVLFAIPLTESLYGTDAANAVGFTLAFVIPLYNVAAVLILEYYGEKGKGVSAGALAKKVITNPLILGAVTGLIFWVLRIPLPSGVKKPIEALASSATPLAVIALGGTLHLSDFGPNMKYLLPTVSVKLVIWPALAVGLATLLGFEGLERFIFFIFFATPIAVSSYPMAENMGCDGKLAGQLVVLSTLLSVLTIFLWILLLKSTGLI